MTKKKRGNPQNLDPCRTKEVARERGRLGGLAAAKARRQQKTAQDIALAMLNGQGEIALKYRDQVAKAYGIEPEDVTNLALTISKQIERSIKKGDPQSAKIVLEYGIGKPDQNVNMKHEIDSAVVQSIFDSVAGKGEDDE